MKRHSDHSIKEKPFSMSNIGVYSGASAEADNSHLSTFLYLRFREVFLFRASQFKRDRLLTTDNGGFQDMKNLKKRHFHKCLQKAGLRRIRFHDLRHTFASLLIQNGESLTYVKEQLGHSSIKITVDVYGHLVPGPIGRR
jgi:integrase